MKFLHAILIPLFCLNSFFAFAQQENSLLYEISGNGLKQTSYLYGTMHVSKKIAFRLDDVFYKALDQCEVVALESDPESWLEVDQTNNYARFGFSGSLSSKGFYTHRFKVDNPRREILSAYLAYDDRMVNNILYRSDRFAQNFEEDTYLDMFIYQAGKKFNKPIVALEDLEESSSLVARASLNAIKSKPDEWLKKKMQRSNPMLLLQNAYRQRNIALLDSINQAMYTQHYMKNMLFIRNQNMVTRLDSLLPKSKVFAGIGAAHLPGENGVISLLRNKGYTIKALTSGSSAIGTALKLKFENKQLANTYAVRSSEDEFFSLELPGALYPVSDLGKTTYISPDLANGSFVVINRIPTHAFLKQNAIYTITDIEKLLFENIPGKIIKTREIENDGYKGLDITNRLKNGNYQRYQIFKTPLEILIFKMGGKGNYVTQHSDRIFNSVTFRKAESKQIRVTSTFRDFSVLMPKLYSFTNKSRNGDRWVEGYDQDKDTYYFLRRSVLNDFSGVEADSFELKQIQKRFYQDLKLKPRYREVANNRLISSAIFDNTSGKRLHLLTTVRQGEYYLLGVLTNYGKAAEEFFSSLTLKPTSYSETFKTVVDTALYFTTKTSVRPPGFVQSSFSYYSGAPEFKPYDAYFKKTAYRNKNDEAIAVELNKAHDFLMFKNLDSAWALRKKLYQNDKFLIREQAVKTSAEGYHEMLLKLSDTASSRSILVKNIIKDGLLYEIKAIVDSLHKPTRFVSEFFNHFTPLDTVIGRNQFENKVPDFFAALQKNDSIILDGYRYLKFEKQDQDSLQYYIANHNYNQATRQIQTALILALGKIKFIDATPFFKDFYSNAYHNSTAQAAILQAISKKADEASVELLLELMAIDLPLLSSTFQISYIFAPYRDNLPVAKKLFPNLMQYSTIPEYKAPIFSLLAQLVANDLLKPNRYKKYKSQILSDAKIQLKRATSSAHSKDLNNMGSAKKFKQNTVLLQDYITLLFPYKKEKKVAAFFKKVALISDPDIITTYMALLAKNNINISQNKLTELAASDASRVMLYKKMKSVGRADLIVEPYNTQAALAASIIYKTSNFSSLQDSLKFLTHKRLTYKGKTYTGYYFKKINKTRPDADLILHLLVFNNDQPLQVEPYYDSGAMTLEEVVSDEQGIDIITEKFELKDRHRAEVFRPDKFRGGHEYFRY